MVAIKFNGVRKSPGRPTLVHGVEGRRHVNNKILRALEASHKNNSGYNSYSTYKAAPDGMNWDDEVKKLGMENNGATQIKEDAAGFQWYPTGEATELETQVQEVQDVQEVQEVQDVQDVQELQEPSEPFCENDLLQNECDYSQTVEQTNPQYGIDDEGGNEATSEIPMISSSHSLEEGFEIGPALRACIEETNSYPVLTEHQMQCITTEPLQETSPVSESDEYYDYPEDGFLCGSPQSLDWLEEFEQNESRVQKNRTTILRVPSVGIVSSCRGTVELLVHADGRTFKPIYNKCGILIAVHCSDGYTLVKNRFKANEWSLVDPAGEAINDDVIIAVAFDKQGNLSFRCESGRLVTLCTDGQIVTFT